MPGKVANFVLRVCKGCLPTTAALIIKKVNISDRCPWCHIGKETDMHILFQCDFARMVWYQSGIQLLNTIMPEDSVFEVLRRMFDSVSREQCIRICLLCWSLWNRRNMWVWDKANGSAFGVNAAASNLFHDWKEAHEGQVKSLSAMNVVADKKWRKPPDDWYKINVDATGACNSYIGFGCVIRDLQGNFIAARCGRLRGNCSSKEAEALSLKEAIIWIQQQHLDQCIFETDLQNLALACYSEEGYSYFHTIVNDCKLVLKHFNHVLVKFVFRSANCVAHELARVAHSMSDLGE